MSELSQTAADVLSIEGDDTLAGVAGETLTAGMPVYFDFDTDTYLASRANVEAKAACDGIALNSASEGQPLTIKRGVGNSIINLGATLVPGMTYVVSDATAGKIMPITDLTPGDFPVVLGVAQSTTELILGIVAAGTGLGT